MQPEAWRLREDLLIRALFEGLEWHVRRPHCAKYSLRTKLRMGVVHQ